MMIMITIRRYTVTNNFKILATIVDGQVEFCDTNIPRLLRTKCPAV